MTKKTCWDKKPALRSNINGDREPARREYNKVSICLSEDQTLFTKGSKYTLRLSSYAAGISKTEFGKIEGRKTLKQLFKGDQYVPHNRGRKFNIEQDRNFKTVFVLMKLPKSLDMTKYYKTCDTNIITTIENSSSLRTLFQRLHITKDIKSLYDKDLHIKVQLDQFIKFMRIFEVNVLCSNINNVYDSFNCVKKIFTNAESAEAIYFDRLADTLSTSISLHIYTESGYLYFEFSDAKGKVIYIVSQRSAEQNYHKNCAFIHRDLII